ncbi:PAS domain S-box-containing protein [Duganella sp. 3397]|uniref:hybrid sensor histidine kinase/response regulator n=1 Tax=Duganella sp. 3397 TaxID=2817732 RepID=UPI00285B27B6|nr:ATP-binding protein [Duganella sp. 3397]MDR7049005.1 PAS domain S-box-containing protein [Duganella sp. 3397]
MTSLMAARVYEYDWAATGLGHIADWPPSLRVSVNLILASDFPSCLFWGGDMLMIYNDGYMTLMGQKPDGLGRPLAEVWSEVWDDIEPILARAWQGKSTFIEDFPLMVDRDGQIREAFFTFCYSPVLDEQGVTVGVLDTVVETTAKVRALRETARYSAALKDELQVLTQDRDRIWQLSSDAMALLDSDNGMAAVNPAFSRTLGWQEDELAGTPVAALIHPLERDVVIGRLDAIRHGQGSPRIEVRLRHKRGEYIYMEWTNALNGNFLLGIGRDSTAERAAAEALKRTEAALHQARKMEAMGKLTGGVAHDFNNLLQVISGNLHLLSHVVAGDSRGQRYVDSALGGVRRGARLASYLLAFGRRQALAPRVIKVGALIAAMDDMLARSLGETIEVVTVIPPGTWSALVDTAQVENAVLNLCINGRDAMNGNGRLTIEVANASLDEHYAQRHADVQPGQYVLIAVTDTGCGMPPEVLGQAFDPFFSTKPEGQGTGLGLSMVFGFVKQSGGHVNIYSEVGSGTTVKLYLPRCLEEEDACVAEPEAGAVVGGNETVLVVEDDEGVRETAVELLRQLGYSVLKAADATAALSILDSGIGIDLLFTDVVMPGPLRSTDLVRLARQKTPGLAVLYTSGYAENAIVHGGRLEPGVQLLGKPYSREALARKVRQVLTGPVKPG